MMPGPLQPAQDDTGQHGGFARPGGPQRSTTRSVKERANASACRALKGYVNARVRPASAAPRCLGPVWRRGAAPGVEEAMGRFCPCVGCSPWHAYICLLLRCGGGSPPTVCNTCVMRLLVKSWNNGSRIIGRSTHSNRVARKLEQPAVGGAHDQKWWLLHRLQADGFDLEHSAEGRIHHPRRRQATGGAGRQERTSPGAVARGHPSPSRRLHSRVPGENRPGSSAPSRDVGAKVHASRSWSVHSVAGSAGARHDSHHRAVPQPGARHVSRKTGLLFPRRARRGVADSPIPDRGRSAFRTPPDFWRAQECVPAAGAALKGLSGG